MTAKEEWVSKRRADHPWKKVQVKLTGSLLRDRTPEFGAALIYDVHDPRTGETWTVWEQWGHNDPHGLYTVYRWNLEPETLGEMNLDFEALSNQLNISPHRLRDMAHSSNMDEQGAIYLWLAYQEGPSLFDLTPEYLTRKQLEERWPELDWGPQLG